MPVKPKRKRFQWRVSGRIPGKHRSRVPQIIENVFRKIVPPEGKHYFFGVHTISREIERQLGIELTRDENMTLQSTINRYLTSLVSKGKLAVVREFPFPKIASKKGTKAYCLPSESKYVKKVKSYLKTNGKEVRERFRSEHYKERILPLRASHVRKRKFPINLEMLFSAGIKNPVKRQWWRTAFKKTIEGFLNNGKPMLTADLSQKMRENLILEGEDTKTLDNRDITSALANLITLERNGYIKVRRAGRTRREGNEYIPLRRFDGKPHAQK